MKELSIKIKICDRMYPMKVNTEEEERIRAISKKINQRIFSYQKKFGIKDYQDLLAMVAFDCLVDLHKVKNIHEVQIEKKLIKLSEKIQNMLAN